MVDVYLNIQIQIQIFELSAHEKKLMKKRSVRCNKSSAKMLFYANGVGTWVLRYEVRKEFLLRIKKCAMIPDTSETISVHLAIDNCYAQIEIITQKSGKLLWRKELNGKIPFCQSLHCNTGILQGSKR